MNILQRPITRFIYEKIIFSLIVALIIGAAAGILWGFQVLLSFFAGYIIGCIYFLLISCGTGFLLKNKSGKVRKTHFLAFTLRYLLMALVLACLIKYTNINVFALIAGLTVINIALVISTFAKKAFTGEGGEYGRS